MLIGLLFAAILPITVAFCPSGSLQWPSNPPSNCYFFRLTNLTFAASEAACNKIGGNLPSIHDAFVNSMLREYTSAVFTAPDFWIGASRPSSHGNWTWTDGSASNFSNWANSEPNCENNYAVMSMPNGLWRSADGNSLKLSVCVVADNPITIPTLTPAASNCSDDWYYYEETNSCWHRTDLMEWGTAEQYCISQNSHLASIHSKSEFDFAHSLYNGDAWVGLYSYNTPITANTTWSWSDNSEVNFLNWAFPFLPSFNEWKCVEMHMNAKYGPGFANINCTTKNYALCKKPAATVFMPSRNFTTTL